MDKEKNLMLKVLKDISQPTPQLPQKRKPSTGVSTNWKKNPNYRPTKKHTSLPYVALDCEMVSTEKDPNTLAQVAIVDFDGHVLLNEYVKPDSEVKNYRSSITGIRSKHLKNAKSFPQVQALVKNIIEDKIVVGHSISHDLKALDLQLDQEKVRDTQKLFKAKTQVKAVSLQKLSFDVLGKVIQLGKHCPVEDARSTIEIFKALFLHK